MQTFVSLLVAAALPPVGVLMKKGLGMAFLINLVLCLFFWIPGILHALWVICNDD
ncbi:MAG: YqaE/Pmp3 family membrane protein [Myxococcales bacterium]|nr:YqaE/Pmp3 family membrane protein [Myxococcales bacterium]